MNLPLVSVICLCYNHEKFIEEAIQSVLIQSYKNLQIIIVDDSSTDASVSKIQQIRKLHPHITFIQSSLNQGICKAFNQALPLAEGSYIIDFATDDVMVVDKIDRQVRFFEQLDNSYGVVFTDAIYIDEKGNFLKNHFEYLFQKKLISHIPEDNIYENVLSTYFIASPSMMVRKSVFQEIGGYDETLSYEDFDFWIRSSRKFKYAYLSERLIKIRRTSNSMSTGWYKKGDTQLYSTYLVCRKARSLSETPAEIIALAKRIKYELRQSVFSENVKEAQLFYHLLCELDHAHFFDRVVYFVTQFNLPLSFLRKWYHQIRFGKL